MHLYLMMTNVTGRLLLVWLLQQEICICVKTSFITIESNRCCISLLSPLLREDHKTISREWAAHYACAFRGAQHSRQ